MSAVNKVLIILFILQIHTSCKKDSKSLSLYPCHLSNQVIDSLKDQKGIFTKLEGYNNAAVQVTEENSIDVTHVYISCGVNNYAFKVGQEVTISGLVRSSSYSSPIVGTDYFEIDLSSIK